MVDIAEALRAAAEHRGIPFDGAFANVESTPEGAKVQLGTMEKGSLLLGPLPIPEPLARAFVKRAGWHTFKPPSERPN